MFLSFKGHQCSLHVELRIRDSEDLPREQSQELELELFKASFLNPRDGFLQHWAAQFQS